MRTSYGYGADRDALIAIHYTSQGVRRLHLCWPGDGHLLDDAKHEFMRERPDATNVVAEVWHRKNR